MGVRAFGAKPAQAQAEVWADIAEKSQRMGADSPTGAMEEIFLRHAGFADRCVEQLRPGPRQAGALFIIDGRVVGFDLFDCASTLRRLLPKLVRSVAMDAADRRTDDSPVESDAAAGPSLTPGTDRRGAAGRRQRVDPVSGELLIKVAEHFLERTCAADVHAENSAVGMGRDLRLTAPAISGAALEVNEVIVHLSAFHV